MKKFMRIGGILVVIFGIILCMIGGDGVEASQPMEIRSGVVIDGEYKFFDSGYIGGSPEGEEAGKGLQAFGVITIIAGVFMFLISFAFRDPEESPYL